MAEEQETKKEVTIATPAMQMEFVQEFINLLAKTFPFNNNEDALIYGDMLWKQENQRGRKYMA